MHKNCTAVQLSFGSGVSCSSPVTEDVPPRRDWSIQRVPPSVTGLVHSRSIFLHPTSVNTLHTYAHTCMLHSAGHIQLNLINELAFSPHSETRRYFESSLKYHVVSGLWPLCTHFRCECSFALSGLEIFTSFCVYRCCGPFAAVALSLQNLFRHRISFAQDSAGLSKRRSWF